MVKRASETGQIDKKDYERLVEQQDSSSVPVQHGFERAPAQVQQKRRIVRVARRPDTGSGGGSGGSSGIFSKVNIAPPPRAGAAAAMPAGAAAAAAMPAPPSVSFGTTGTAAATFMGGTASAATTAVTFGSSSAVGSGGGVLNEHAKQQTNKLYSRLRSTVKEMAANPGQVNQNWSIIFAKVLKGEHMLAKDSYNRNDDASGNQQQQPQSSGTTNNKTSSSFSFGSSNSGNTAAAATSQPKPFSFGAAPSSAAAAPTGGGGFTFSSSSSSPATSLAASGGGGGGGGFSFGKLPAANSCPAAAAAPAVKFSAPPAAAPATSPAGPSANPFAPSTGNAAAAAAAAAGTTTTTTKDKDAVQPSQDPDWDDVAQFQPVNVYRYKDPQDKESKMTNFVSKGLLRIQQEKNKAATTGGYRMLMHDSVGTRVLVNMHIVPGMTFQHETVEGKNKKKAGIVTFSGLNNEERGIEVFRIKARAEQSQELYNKLVQVSTTSSSS